MSKYFNFGKSVELVKSLFPEETKDITFVETAKPESADQIFDWIQETSRKTRRDIQEIYGGTGSYIKGLKKFPACAVCDMDTGKKLLLMNRDLLKSPENQRIFRDHEKEDAWIFLHELAHLIMEMGIDHCFGSYAADTRTVAKKAYESNLHEHRADLLSVLIGLQSGLLDEKDVEHLSRYRAQSFVEGDFAHMTSQTIDRLLLDCKGHVPDHISHRTLMRVAEDYIEAYAPTLEDFTNSVALLKHNLGDGTEEENEKNNNKSLGIKDIIRTCNEAPADSVIFYGLARTLTLCLNRGLLDPLLNKAEREDLRKVIFQKSLSVGTDGILAQFKEEKIRPQIAALFELKN